MKISGLITFLREKYNLTQQGFSEKTGLSLSTIQKYEYGSVEPKEKSLSKIVNAFGYNNLLELRKEMANQKIKEKEEQKKGEAVKVKDILDVFSFFDKEEKIKEENKKKMLRILKIIDRFKIEKHTDFISIFDTETKETYNFEDVSLWNFEDCFSELYSEITAHILIYFFKKDFAFKDWKKISKESNEKNAPTNEEDSE